jgi:hypothetical protein
MSAIRILLNPIPNPPLKTPYSPSSASATWINGTGGANGGKTTLPQINVAVKAPISADLRSNVSVDPATRTVTVTVGGNALPGDTSAKTRHLKLNAPMVSGPYTLVVKNEAGKVLSKGSFNGQIPA